MSRIRLVVRRTVALLAIGVVSASCGGVDGRGTPDDASAMAGRQEDRRLRFRYPAAPPSPAAAESSAPEALAAIEDLTSILRVGEVDPAALDRLAATGDARHAWYLSDLMRFFGGGERGELTDAFQQLTGVSLAADPDNERSVWLSATNHLIAWDVPAYPGYREHKAGVLLLVEPGWEPFFADSDAAIDWRHVSWGGVRIDDRPLGDPDGCARGCIPALDDPAVTDAAGGDWYPDDAIVFGLTEGDEALAIPKHVAEIHEMFNLSLGDRRFAVPYCTLCGSAQAYRTDDTGAEQEPVLRTSGLLSRSNKVMYDLVTSSAFDTFTGGAVSGPLQDAGVVLEAVTVVRTTWGEWRQAHPDTRIIAEDGGIGRSYPLDPLQGRDDGGPIFPIGPADDRLAVHELVVGVIGAGGVPVAFPADVASVALSSGEAVRAAGVELVADGGGLRANDVRSGEPLAAHESFWFAWSQFHPDTELWSRRPQAPG